MDDRCEAVEAVGGGGGHHPRVSSSSAREKEGADGCANSPSLRTRSLCCKPAHEAKRPMPSCSDAQAVRSPGGPARKLAVPWAGSGSAPLVRVSKSKLGKCTLIHCSSVNVESLRAKVGAVLAEKRAVYCRANLFQMQPTQCRSRYLESQPLPACSPAVPPAQSRRNPDKHWKYKKMRKSMQRRPAHPQKSLFGSNMLRPRSPREVRRCEAYSD